MKLLIAAGGTGGHIYPALAIAEALIKKHPGSSVEFVGTAHGLENKIVPAKGYRLHHLPIGRLNSNVSILERLKTLLTMPLALVKSWRILRDVKPDLVLGVGGNASGPLLLVASWRGDRTAIWEPNAMPGLTNRWLARFVDRCYVVFSEARAHLKSKHLELAGMPVRAEIENVHLEWQAPPCPFRVLVFGGSQGARGINNALLALAQSESLSDYEIVHQTGALDFAKIREACHNPHVNVKEYLHDMSAQYARADLVVCRSGTGTLSELAACGKASILIPLPTASDDHQRKNAESLVQKGAAILLLQKDLSAQSLFRTMEDLRLNPERLAKMSEAVRHFHQPHAAERLVATFEGDHAPR